MSDVAAVDPETLADGFVTMGTGDGSRTNRHATLIHSELRQLSKAMTDTLARIQKVLKSRGRKNKRYLCITTAVAHTLNRASAHTCSRPTMYIVNVLIHLAEPKHYTLTL